MANFNLNDLMNTKDLTSFMDPQDAQSNKVMGILAYLGILVLIPIFAAPNSKFARFHANQGLVLLIAGFVVAFVLSFLSNIPLLGIIFSLLSFVWGLCTLAFMVIGILNVINGTAKELPIIGTVQLLK